MSDAASVPAEREGRPAPDDLLERRRAMIAAFSDGVVGEAAKRPVGQQVVDGIRTLYIGPKGREPEGYLLLLHGGGFRIGWPENDAWFAERLADRCGIEVILPAYRLAPEFPFPAGFNDAWNALVRLRARIGGAPMFVGGDSAGGGLAAALCVHAARRRELRVDGALLLSPWLDLTVTAASFKENVKSEKMFPAATARGAAELYLQGFDPRHPLASPLFADVTGFPPTFISVGTGESLRDDAFSFHRKLMDAGLYSELCAMADMEHVAVVRGEKLVGSRETFEAVAAFLLGHLRGNAFGDRLSDGE